MRYTLMHKNGEAALVNLDVDDGKLRPDAKVIDISMMPPGTVRGGFFDPNALQDWWKGRCIPVSRQGASHVFEKLPGNTFLAMKSMGLSLTDHYWVRPEGSGVSWEDVNLFDNGFSGDIGDLLFGKDTDVGNLDFPSPDPTTEGNLRKRWTEDRRLLKSGTVLKQEPFNEAIACRIADALGVPRVHYDIVWEGNNPLSSCPDFVTKDTEFVSAHKVMKSFKDRNNGPYRHYVDCCGELGIDIVPSLDRMLVLDYIMANFDRHTNNFGLIRDADTLEYTGPAPIFDTGSSLGCDTTTYELGICDTERCKPFRRSFREQMELVSSFDWIDFDALERALPKVKESLEPARRVMEDKRIEWIIDLLESRMNSLKSMS